MSTFLLKNIPNGLWTRIKMISIITEKSIKDIFYEFIEEFATKQPEEIISQMERYGGTIIKPREESSFIYFIQSGKDGPIKIGTTNNVESRLGDIRVLNPQKIKLLKSIKGTQKYEKEIHRKFKNDRIKGEWFRLSSDLIEFINSLPENS